MPVLNVNEGVNVSVAIAESNSFEVTINKGALNGGVPGGNSNTLQYNNNGVFGGVPTTNYANGVLTLGSNTSISITGGTNGTVLSTDGNGGLSWVVAPASNIANYAYFANVANTANLALAVVGDVTIPFNYGDATPKNLTIAPANSVVTSVSIVMLTAFDDVAATLTIGDAGNTARLMLATDNNANSTGIYTTEPVFKYNANTQLTLSISPGTSTVGSGLVLINYKEN